MISASQITQLSRHADPHIVQAIVDHAAAVFAKYAINTPLRVQHLFAHMDVESQGFTRLTENLNYSAKRLTQVWPSRFPSLAAAAPFAMNEKALADKVYGGRMGNTGQDDGYLNRGQGLLQTTGHDNIAMLAKHLGVDFETARTMLTSEDGMLECAVANFVFNGAVPHADKDDIVGTTKAVNGGLNGLDERKAALHLCKVLFK